jgi:hypothetical protein
VCKGQGIERIMDGTARRMFGRNKEYTSINYRTKMSVYWAGIIWSRINISGGVS